MTPSGSPRREPGQPVPRNGFCLAALAAKPGRYSTNWFWCAGQADRRAKTSRGIEANDIYRPVIVRFFIIPYFSMRLNIPILTPIVITGCVVYFSSPSTSQVIGIDKLTYGSMIASCDS